MHSIIEMLRYKRPEGTQTQREFCERFLEPTFGKPDIHGNYILQIGDKPNLCFAAHHDTVHNSEGMQQLIVMNDVVSVADSKVSNCLGADCTTGIYILMAMIEHGIEGVYVVHAAEEIGCKGSGAIVFDDAEWIHQLDAVISFDRYGDKSIITHQMGYRTCSDEFAKSFSEALGLPQLKADDGGSYTDSNEYAGIVSECTNISVGYYNQHTKNETQDLEYLDLLVTALLSADWSKLVFVRDPDVVDPLYTYNRRGSYFGTYDSYYGREPMSEKDGLLDVVCNYPEEVAELLESYGFTSYSLMEECHIEDSSQYASYMDNYALRRYP